MNDLGCFGGLKILAAAPFQAQAPWSRNSLAEEGLDPPDPPNPQSSQPRFGS